MPAAYRQNSVQARCLPQQIFQSGRCHLRIHKDDEEPEVARRPVGCLRPLAVAP